MIFGRERRVVEAAMRLELRHLFADRVFVALAMFASASVLCLVSLFGLTASEAPVALVVDDKGPYTRPFVEALASIPHAFRLTRMTKTEASAALDRGDLAGAITLPRDFSFEIAAGGTVPVEVEIDNVNVDMVADIQRAMPGAIVRFGRSIGLPGLRVRLEERDLWPRDTSFLPYLTVSGLGLVALLVAGVLGAMAMTREFESNTVRIWRTSPAASSAIVGGKILAATAVGFMSITVATLVVVFGYGVIPAHPIALGIGLLFVTAMFACVGASLGIFVRRTLVVLPLLFGLAMPLYIESGALEPTRFDGETIWYLSHFTPLYYVVGWLEWAFFGLRITPEPNGVNLAAVVLIGAGAFALALWRLSKSTPVSRGTSP